ncbi:MAG: MotA/TolQ/ExbB proton channel family protein [bacterium]
MWDIIQCSGPVLWVVAVIFLSGAAAFITFVERGFHLHRARIKADDFLHGILNILKAGNIEEALAICDETPGPVARIARTAILHRAEGREMLDAAVNDSGLSEISRLESRVGVISTVAQIAPLLGLLGTVLGMMTLLGDLEVSQWQSARVTLGLKHALTATAAGLIVAVPCYVAYNLVVGKIESLVVEMERVASEVTAFLRSQNK